MYLLNLQTRAREDCRGIGCSTVGGRVQHSFTDIVIGDGEGSSEGIWVREGLEPARKIS